MTAFTRQNESGHQPVFGQSAVPFPSPPWQLSLIPVAPAPEGTGLLLFLVVAALHFVFGQFVILQLRQAF